MACSRGIRCQHTSMMGRQTTASADVSQFDWLSYLRLLVSTGAALPLSREHILPLCLRSMQSSYCPPEKNHGGVHCYS